MPTTRAGRMAWAGINSAGFAIANSASYNLPAPGRGTAGAGRRRDGGGAAHVPHGRRPREARGPAPGQAARRPHELLRDRRRRRRRNHRDPQSRLHAVRCGVVSRDSACSTRISRAAAARTTARGTCGSTGRASWLRTIPDGRLERRNHLPRALAGPRPRAPAASGARGVEAVCRRTRRTGFTRTTRSTGPARPRPSSSRASAPVRIPHARRCGWPWASR